MRIVTIARELGALTSTQEVALCQAIGLRMVARKVLESRFLALGTDTELMQRYDERKPRMLESLLGRPDAYSQTLRTTILYEAMQGDVAIIGRGANFLLGGMVECLRLRFIAPLETRAERVTEQLQCTREQALDTIRKSDRERIGFCYYFYNKNWQDADSYDLTVNTAEINVTDLAETLQKLSALKGVSSQGKSHLLDNALSQRISFALLITENMEIHCLEIQCSNGNVVLSGIVAADGMPERVTEIVQKLDGVRSLKNQLQIAPANIPWDMYQ